MSASPTGRPATWLQTSLSAWEPASWSVTADWRELVEGFFGSAEGQRLGKKMAARLVAGATIYPPRPLRALELTSLESVRVVILGQDPYHGPGQANGLAFSVAPGVAPPPSLRNIQAEIAQERQANRLAPPDPLVTPTQGVFNADLTRWARQGVLLINSCLTVEKGQPASHSQLGWEVLTGKIIDAINRKQGPVAYLLWGRHAQNRRPCQELSASGAPRLFLQCNHPSPLSARRGPVPFMGCGHFALANAFLLQHGACPIEW